jgi:hypothetical protein
MIHEDDKNIKANLRKQGGYTMKKIRAKFSKKAPRLLKPSKLNPIAAGLIIIFLVAASLIIVRIFAAGTSVPIEPENGIISGNASVRTDANASGGKYVQFGQKGFVTANGTNFYNNGTRFVFTGLNLHQALMTTLISGCASWAANKDLGSAFTQIGGGKEAMRIFGLQLYLTKSGLRDWVPMDNAVAAAKAHNVKLIVALVDQWDYCEPPYKTAAYWQSGYKTTVLPNESVPYRQYVSEITARYKNEPTIMMWELANEPLMSVSKTDSTCPANANADMQAWAADVSSLIKQNDPNHLVAIGSGRGMCGMYGKAFQTINSISTINACSYHDYTPVGTNYLIDPNIGLNTRTSQCHAINKPIYVGESGIKIADEPDLASRAVDFDKKITAQFNLGVEGFSIWNWSNGGSIYNYEVGPNDPVLNVLANH